jgi:dynein heavy chain
MYQFSLAYFTKVFNGAVERTKGEEGRVKLLIENVTESLFVNICRGLFNDHKRIFAMMLASKIEMKGNPIYSQTIYLLT